MTKKLEEDVFKETFERFWPDLEKMLQTLPPVKGGEKPKRKVEDMVEEILETVRGLAFMMQKREEIPSFFDEPVRRAITTSLEDLPEYYRRKMGSKRAISSLMENEEKEKEAERAEKEKLKEKAKMPY